MIDSQTVNRLFLTMSNDMNLKLFNDEDASSFRRRVLYSALGKWIMFLFADRDFEEDQSGQITKSHITISALDIINSWKKISNEAKEFFLNPEETVKEIERVYINIGYINSGDRTFIYPKSRQRVSFDFNSLIIDADTNVKKYYGLGIFGKPEEGDISLNDFYLIKDNALDYFKNLANNLDYEIFSQTQGVMEIYNIDYNRWDLYSENLAKKYEYSIIRLDHNLTYKIIRLSGDTIYSATLPSIYSEEDIFFKHEVWRIILGMCAFNGKPAEAAIRDYHEKGIKISLGGYMIPFSERAILRCSTWPSRDSTDIFELIANKHIENKIIEILEHLSIKVIKEEE